MSGFYKILANKALDENLMGALKIYRFFKPVTRAKRMVKLSHCAIKVL